MAAVTLHESHQYNSNDRINVATLKILNFILKQDLRVEFSWFGNDFETSRRKAIQAAERQFMAIARSGVASSVSAGDIFIYSCSAQLTSFQIDSISKETNVPLTY